MTPLKKTAKGPRLIGTYIRQKREILGVSQRELGLRLNPPVTTQFISNMERGVTPLPPSHIPALALALGVTENDITQILEKEFLLRISERSKGTSEVDEANHQEILEHSAQQLALLVHSSHHEFMVRLAESLPAATLPQLDALATVCEQHFRIPARVLLRSLFAGVSRAKSSDSSS